ncbi:MAG: hypothetical protein GY729_12940 [Desulfobacteraceae bacterium]|nr:hypothetical protein [Desulfobacteraceae bacterium]
MKNSRNKGFVIAAIIFMTVVFAAAGYAQESNKPNSPQSPQEQVLTDEYKAKVASILSKYNGATLTQADAIAINNAFREAGIRQGQAQQEAIIAAGFDPKRISSLDPPPSRKEQGPKQEKKNE